MMSHRWHRVMEASQQRYQPRYLLVADQRGPLAAVIANATSMLQTGGVKSLLQRLMLVVSGPFSSTECGVVVRPGVTLTEAMPQILPGLQALAWQMKRPALGISNVFNGDLPAWRAQGFVTIGQASYNMIDLIWPSYASYVDSLAPKQRSELRRMRKRAATMDVRFERELLREDDPRLFPLLAEVFERHGVSRAEMPFTEQMFPALIREMPDRVMLIKGYVGETLAGYMLCLLGDDTISWPAAGLHYPLAHPSYLYFLLIDEMIQWAIVQGYRQIIGGLTNEREKQKFGFTLRSRSLCLRASPPLLNAALTTALPIAQGLRRRGAERRAQQPGLTLGRAASEPE
jgi:predicted N-acyltransferase